MTRAITPEMRELQQAVYQAGEDVGMQLVGRSDWGDFTESLAGQQRDPLLDDTTPDTSGTKIGMTGEMTVAVGADGQLVNQARHRREGDAPSTHLLKIWVAPTVTFGVDGNVPIIRWIANVTVFELTKSRVVLSEGSADEAGERALAGDRPRHVYGNDPAYRGARPGFLHETPREAVRAALEKISSNGLINLPGPPDSATGAPTAPTMAMTAGGRPGWLLPLVGLAVGLALIALLLVFTGGGDPETQTAEPPAVEVPPTPAPAATADPPVVETEQPPPVTEPAPRVSEPTLEDLLPPEFLTVGIILRAAGYTNDEIVDHLRSSYWDGRRDYLYSQSDTPPGNGAPDVDLRVSGALTTAATAAQRRALFANTVFPCGGGPDGMTTVCDGYFEPGTIGTDGIVILVTAFDAPVASESWNYAYSAVFDSDGDPANNFQASGSFDWDQYQGTDRWWVLDIVGGVPRLGRFDGSFSTQTQTGARVVIADNAIVWFIPRVELGADPTWRATSFRHDGSYDPVISGGDVTGANPTEPLLPIPVKDVTLTEEG